MLTRPASARGKGPALASLNGWSTKTFTVPPKLSQSRPNFPVLPKLSSPAQTFQSRPNFPVPPKLSSPAQTFQYYSTTIDSPPVLYPVVPSYDAITVTRTSDPILLLLLLQETVEAAVVFSGFENVRIQKPTRDNDGKPLRPHECRERGLMYPRRMTADFGYRIRLSSATAWCFCIRPSNDYRGGVWGICPLWSNRGRVICETVCIVNGTIERVVRLLRIPRRN